MIFPDRKQNSFKIDADLIYPPIQEQDQDFCLQFSSLSESEGTTLINDDINVHNEPGLPILVGCEESQVLCAAFRAVGLEAYSCDLQPTRGNISWHYQEDIINVIPLKRWGLIVLHPDCTAMALSGNRWYGKGKPMNHKRQKAVEWTLKLWEIAKKYSDRVALENPVSVIFNYLPNVFYLQPYEHGHGETKKTGFALHGLNPLIPTDRVEGREQRIWKMPPSRNRKRDRSQTYPGVAKAIVEQWGIILKK